MKLFLLEADQPSRLIELPAGVETNLVDQVDLEKNNNIFVLNALEEKDNPRVAVMDGDEVVSAAAWSEEPDVFWIHMFGSTRSGAGSTILRFLAKGALSKKKPIWLNSISGMEGYYQKLGFRRELSTGLKSNTFAIEPGELLKKLGS